MYIANTPYFSIIAAIDKKNGIGRKGAIPWRNKTDMMWFRNVTTGATDLDTLLPRAQSNNICIMGRITYESIASRANDGKLPGRQIIVVSGAEIKDEHAVVVPTFAAALTKAHSLQGPRTLIFVCGGEALYREALAHPLCLFVALTEIDGDYECDRFFPSSGVMSRKTVHQLEDGTIVKVHKMINGDECSYLRILADLSDTSACIDTVPNETSVCEIPNRTGVNTRAMFSKNLRYSLCDALGRRIVPLMTTRFISLKIAHEELMWMLRGETNTKSLNEKKITIWDKNASSDFIKKSGNNYPQGELGPIYGFQWRHFGADYDHKQTFTGGHDRRCDERDRRCDERDRRCDERDRRCDERDRRCDERDRRPGLDQVAALIEGLKKDPYSRRHIITAWNPAQIKQAVLPPCHVFIVANVRSANYRDSNGAVVTKPTWLSLAVTMRSNDMFHGHPYNVAFYALFAHYLAAVTGYRAAELTINMVDCHVYVSHLEAINQQLERHPSGFPHITFSPRVDDLAARGELKLEDITFGDVVLHDYHKHPSINVPMVE
jgi:dihydrofolate reductase/thymidylate synthase